MLCFKCERPEHLCECLGNEYECSVVDHPVYHKGGGKSSIPAVEVTCGEVRVGDWGPLIPSQYDYTVFRDHAKAVAFAEFLNSDAVFDCEVPRQFLH